MEIKEGYEKKVDPLTGVVHLYPKDGRKHYFDKCWCNPIRNRKTGMIAHHEVKENYFQCK